MHIECLEQCLAQSTLWAHCCFTITEAHGVQLSGLFSPPPGLGSGLCSAPYQPSDLETSSSFPLVSSSFQVGGL